MIQNPPFVSIPIVVSVCLHEPWFVCYACQLLLSCGSYCWPCDTDFSLVGNAILNSSCLQLPDLVTCFLCLPFSACWAGVCVNDVMNWMRDLIHLKQTLFFFHLHMPVSKITQALYIFCWAIFQADLFHYLIPWPCRQMCQLEGQGGIWGSV